MAALKAGANVALTREIPTLDRLAVGVQFGAGSEKSVLDQVVMMTLLCDDAGQVISDEHAVFFNQLTTQDLSVGTSEQIMGADTEQVEIVLSQVPAVVARIVVIAYTNEAVGARRTLAQLKQCTVRAVNAADGVELVRSENLAATWGLVSAAALAEVYRHQGGWKFKVRADGYAGGITALAKDFGLPL